MLTLFQEIQSINRKQKSVFEAFADHTCDGCKREFASEIKTGSILTCDVLPGYVVCEDCQKVGLHDPNGEGYCFGDQDDETACAPFRLSEGWYYHGGRRMTTCLSHNIGDIFNDRDTVGYELINNPVAHFRVFSETQRFYSNKDIHICDEPIADVNMLKLTTVLTTEARPIFPPLIMSTIGSRIVELFSELFRNPAGWFWSWVEEIDDSSSRFSFQKYGSIQAWIPFDFAGRYDTRQPARYYYLVYCDPTNAELFGQVMIARFANGAKNPYVQIYGTKIKIEQYLGLRHGLFTLLESLFSGLAAGVGVSFPTPLVSIICDYCEDEWEFADRFWKLADYLALINKILDIKNLFKL